VAAVLILRDREAAARLGDPQLRRLILQRIRALADENPEYALDQLCRFVIVEPGDRAEALAGQLGFHPLRNRSEAVAFGQPEFIPPFELAEEHAAWYELVFVLGDDGFGLEVFGPKAPGVDPELLAMCAAYAVPAAEEGPP
jgi:hypothetical protein